MAITTASRRSSTANLLQLFLSTLSPESKVIAKAGGGGGGGGGRRQLGDNNNGGSGAFRCRTCGRCFATFQALGGHRTSHNRPRVRAAGLDLLLGARPGKGAAAAGDVHRCNTCGMVFATGQALGGHMRRHRAAVAALFDVAAAAGKPESTATTSGDSDDEEDDAGHLPFTLIKFI